MLASNQVRSRLYLSYSESKTPYLLRYCTKLGDNGTYGQGVPLSQGGPTEGDGTVEAMPGPIFGDSSMHENGDFGSHTYMVGELDTKVATALVGASLSSASLGDSPAKARKLVSVTPSLMVSVSTRRESDLLLQAPDGAMVGTRATGEVLEELTGSDAVNFRYMRALSLLDPINGTYALTLRTGVPQTGSIQGVDIGYLEEGSGARQTSVRFVKKLADATLQLVFDRSASAPVRFVAPVKSPTGLRAVRAVGGTSLIWTAAADSSVVGYHVYAHLRTETILQLVGTTSSATFGSSLPWASSDEDVREFVVVSINAAGPESFVSGENSVLNRSYVASQFAVNIGAIAAADGATLPFSATFTDQSQATSPITAWAWDFNSDGIIDSTAQKPTFAFPAYGQYTVSLTVTTEDGVDTAIKPALITVSPCAPLQQSASCSLDVNGDGRVDVRDGLLILRRMLGFSGAALTDGVVNASCTSASTQSTIASFVDSQMAGGYHNFDGSQAGTSVASSGLIIYRALQGLTDSSVTANTVRPGATRTTWAGTGQIRDYLNSQCEAGL